MSNQRKTGAPKANCHQCPLYDRPIVPSQFPRGKAILSVVGEAPGYQEAEKGQPFVGPSGQLLKLAFEDTNVDADSVMYTNAVLCHPVNNADPAPEAVEACHPRLIFELKQANAPVLTTGKVGSQALLGGDIKITTERGQRRFHDEVGHVVTPTLHPAFILRPGRPGQPAGYTYYPDFMNDIRGAVQDKIIGQDVTWTMVESESAMIGLLKDAQKAEFFVYDLETNDLTPNVGGILCLGLAFSTREIFIIRGDRLHDFKEHLEKLFQIGVWFGHHIKFDNTWMRFNGLPRPEKFMDTLLMSTILDERTGRRSLKVLCADLLGVADWSKPISDYMSKHKFKSYDKLPRDMLYPYLALDVYNNWMLVKELIARLDAYRDDWKEFYDRVLAPVNRLAEDIYVRGMSVDKNLLDEIGEFTESRAMGILAQIRDEINHPNFNPRSAQQVRKVLFEERGMKPFKKTESGAWSTDKEVIETLRRLYPNDVFLTDLIRYRQAQKLMSSYIKPIKRSLRKGRAYVSHNVGGTETGRLTDTIPEGKRDGASWLTIYRPDTNEFTGKVRGILIADPGYVLLYADYSQNELRTLACEAEDERLIDVFVSGRDPHGETADFFFPGWTEKRFRTFSKRVNFEIVYGGGAKKTVEIGAEEGFDITMRQALDMHELWFENYVGVREFRDRVWAHVYEHQYVETTFGRRRHFPLITHENWAEIQRQSFNTMIQGPANTINMMSAYRLEYELGTQDLLLQHDSIICQVPEDDADRISKLMREVMEATPGELHPKYKLVPFVAEVGIGKNWLEAEKNAK